MLPFVDEGITRKLVGLTEGAGLEERLLSILTVDVDAFCLTKMVLLCDSGISLANSFTTEAD